MKIFFHILLFSVSLLSCTGRQTMGFTEEGDTLSFQYARLIEIVDYEGYSMATVKNPWKEGKVLHRYLLVPYTMTSSQLDELTALTESGTTVVRVPLQRSVIFTSVHAALLEQLGAAKQVAGVADSKYMTVNYVSEGLKNGRITDCGDGMNPMVEKIIDAHADAVLLSPFENSGGYGQLEDIRIPLIECAEYMENSPLARAEWMRFYGRLYGCEVKADSLFAVVDRNYHALCKLAQGQDSHTLPSVLMDKQTGSVWYVPGGRSTIGQMLKDAFCSYPFAADEHSGSLPLPFETILEKAGASDIWLFRYDSDVAITMPKLLSEQQGYAQLNSVKNGNVYGCNVQTSRFYEETPFRPDLLLQDFIHILHPDIPNMPSLRYYHRIEQ